MNVLAVAHRAGNSLAGLRAATSLGVDVIECDVHAYRGRLEVRHLKTAGPLPVLWDRWELASGRGPRLGLAEVLRADRRGAALMVDLKGRRTDVGRGVAQLLDTRSGGDPLLACGRSWASVDQVAGAPGVRPVLSARNRVELHGLRRRLASDRPAPYGVSVHASLLDTATVAALRDHVDVVMTWPVDDDDALRHVLRLGVNAVISNEPAILRAVVAARC